MKNNREPLDLHIDVSAALPAVGDRSFVRGGARVVVEDGYETRFEPGNGLTWSISLRRIPGAVEVKGSMDGSVELQCFRCLEEFTFPLHLELREHALWRSEPTADAAEDDTSEYRVEEGVLDLEPLFRDHVALALPVKRVCREACRGLCPRCGANLDREPCDCEAPTTDGRLESLAALKQKLERREREGGE